MTFSVAAGDTVGLVGPNGSGKSTLLRILAGVDRPTLGAARVLDGDPVARATKARTSYLPDGAPFPAELSTRAALELVASLAGMDRSERRSAVPAMLERVGLGNRTSTKLRAFSRGMHRRFGLAQAFLGAPDVVLLDEPTAGLDAPGFPVLRELLDEARARGATVVLASHVPSDLMDLCNRVVLLRSGRVSRVGAPDELLGEPGAVDARIDLGPSSEPDVVGAIEGTGASVVSSRPARRPLADLYTDPESGR